MRKYIYSIILLLLASFLCAPSLSATPGRSEFRIGVLLPLSGSSASIGQSIRQGIELAELQASPEVKERLKLIVEDDSWNPSNAVAAFRKLTTSDKVHALLVVGSSIGNAIAPLAETQHLPMIAIGASDINVVKNRNYVFNHWVTPESEAALLVEEIKKRGYERIGIISSQQEGLIAICDAVRGALKTGGIADKVLLDESFDRSETDFRTYLSKARAKGIQAIISALYPGSLSSFARQVKKLDSAIQLVGVELFEDESEVKASEGALIGGWYVNIDTPQGAFDHDFLKEYGTGPGFGSANGYDALNLMIRAWENSNSTKGEDLVKILSSVHNFSGASGTYSVTTDNRFNLPAAVKEVTQDGFKKMS